ncbi:MAG: hypothetical protein JRN24_03555 [Nitrososphaerota archaeon]|nr:hypothetical protein [Nitrososphaerota archaeon]
MTPRKTKAFDFADRLKGSVYGSRTKAEELKEIWGHAHPHETGDGTSGWTWGAR